MTHPSAMTPAFICDTICTPFGRYGGALSSLLAGLPIDVRVWPPSPSTACTTRVVATRCAPCASAWGRALH